MSPQMIVSSYLRKRLRDDAKVAALILRAWPEFSSTVGHYKVDVWLSRMGCGEISEDTVLAITEAVPVNGSRTLASMRPWQRDRLAAHLEALARETL
jgi:hypothetical protein